MVVLVIIFVLLHLVGVLVADFFPVNGLATDSEMGSRLSSTSSSSVGWMLVMNRFGRRGELVEGVEVSRRDRAKARFNHWVVTTR
jgi:hypothetical protein